MTTRGHGPMRRELRPGRMHFQHGPIDLIVQADGDERVVRACFERCWERFADVLTDILSDFPFLREEVREIAAAPPFHAAVGQRMWRACAMHAMVERLTPMAAVAGSVADELIGAFHHEGIDRACVNNGGDIALYLKPEHTFVIGMHADPSRLADARTPQPSLVIGGASPIRGVATSGWQGRSFSLGIADAVTILAADAARADAAATVVGNAVTCDAATIERRPASALRDDSDLRDRLVTYKVGALRADEVDTALHNGVVRAGELLRRNLLSGAVITLRGATRYVGAVPIDDARCDSDGALQGRRPLPEIRDGKCVSMPLRV